jgi:hypothetical protein
LVTAASLAAIGGGKIDLADFLSSFFLSEVLSGWLDLQPSR